MTIVSAFRVSLPPLRHAICGPIAGVTDLTSKRRTRCELENNKYQLYISHYAHFYFLVFVHAAFDFLRHS